MSGRSTSNFGCFCSPRSLLISTQPIVTQDLAPKQTGAPRARFTGRAQHGGRAPCENACSCSVPVLLVGDLETTTVPQRTGDEPLHWPESSRRCPLALFLVARNPRPRNGGLCGSSEHECSPQGSRLSTFPGRRRLAGAATQEPPLPTPLRVDNSVSSSRSRLIELAALPGQQQTQQAAMPRTS